MEEETKKNELSLDNALKEIIEYLKENQHVEHSILLPEYVNSLPLDIKESKDVIIQTYFTGEQGEKYLEFNKCAAKGLDLIKKHDLNYGTSSQAGGSDNIKSFGINDVNEKIFGKNYTLETFNSELEDIYNEYYKAIDIELSVASFNAAVGDAKLKEFGDYPMNSKYKYKDHVKRYMQYKQNDENDDLEIETLIKKIKLLHIYLKIPDVNRISTVKVNSIKAKFAEVVKELKKKVEKLVQNGNAASENRSRMKQGINAPGSAGTKSVNESVTLEKAKTHYETHYRDKTLFDILKKHASSKDDQHVKMIYIDKEIHNMIQQVYDSGPIPKINIGGRRKKTHKKIKKNKRKTNARRNKRTKNYTRKKR